MSPKLPTGAATLFFPLPAVPGFDCCPVAVPLPLLAVLLVKLPGPSNLPPSPPSFECKLEFELVCRDACVGPIKHRRIPVWTSWMWRLLSLNSRVRDSRGCGGFEVVVDSEEESEVGGAAG